MNVLSALMPFGICAVAIGVAGAGLHGTTLLFYGHVRGSPQPSFMKYLIVAFMFEITHSILIADSFFHRSFPLSHPSLPTLLP